MWWLSQYWRIMHVNVSEHKNGFWKGCNNPTNARIVEKGFFSTFPFLSEGIFTWLLIWTLAPGVCELLLTTGVPCHSSVKKSVSKSAKKDKPGSLRGCPTRGKSHFHSSWMTFDYVCWFAHSFIYSFMEYWSHAKLCVGDMVLLGIGFQNKRLVMRKLAFSILMVSFPAASL